MRRDIELILRGLTDARTKCDDARKEFIATGDTEMAAFLDRLADDIATLETDLTLRLSSLERQTTRPSADPMLPV